MGKNYKDTEMGKKLDMERTLHNHPNLGYDNGKPCEYWLCGCQNTKAVQTAHTLGYEQGWEDARAEAIRNFSRLLGLEGKRP